MIAALTASPSIAANRVALVIGNGDYKRIAALANPIRDATLMAATLKEVGFDVMLETDVDFAGMRTVIREFGGRLRAAGADAVGLLYFAGHGVQSRDANYLIPLGATIESESDLAFEAVSASDILDQMEFAGNALNLVILDACRDNPYPTRFRSASRGLAKIQSASGSLVAFSAAPGQVAFDGAGAHSPYTAALTTAMKEPGLTVEQVFKRVRIAVETATKGAQTPWEESSLKGDFYFVAKPLRLSPPPPPPPTAAVDKEAMFWRSIERIGDREGYEAYLEEYPDGTFATLARLNIERLAEPEAPEAAAEETDAVVAALAPSDPIDDADAPVGEIKASPDTSPEPTYSVDPILRTLYALKNSNIRGGPGVEFPKVGFLRRGGKALVTGKVRNRPWYRLAGAVDRPEFVHASLLREATEETTATQPSGGGAAPLKAPASASTRVVKVKEVYVSCERGTWIRREDMVISPGVVTAKETDTRLNFSVDKTGWRMEGKYCFQGSRCADLNLYGKLPKRVSGAPFEGRGWIDAPDRRFCKVSGVVG